MALEVIHFSIFPFLVFFFSFSLFLSFFLLLFLSISSLLSSFLIPLFSFRFVPQDKRSLNYETDSFFFLSPFQEFSFHFSKICHFHVTKCRDQLWDPLSLSSSSSSSLSLSLSLVEMKKMKDRREKRERGGNGMSISGRGEIEVKAIRFKKCKSRNFF